MEIGIFVFPLVISFTLLAFQFIFVWHVRFETRMPKMEQLKEGRLGLLNCYMTIEERYIFDWKSLIRPCEQDMSWLSASERQNRQELRTATNKTVVIDQDIKPAGEWSKVIIQTYTFNGVPKRIGGDSLRALLSGEVSQTGFVIDRMDGSYEVHFRPTVEGNFTLYFVMQYSMCDGFRNPPLGWFEKGDIHGHFQKQGTMGVEGIPRLEVKPLMTLSVRSASDTKTIEKSSKDKIRYFDCYNTGIRKHTSCSVIWDSFGNWRRKKSYYEWTDKNRNHKKRNIIRSENSSKLYNKLWIFGDSISYRWWQSSSRLRLCKAMFRFCNHTFVYTYLYEKYDYTKVNLGKKFNIAKFFDPIEIIFKDQHMTNESVLVINFGLHLLMGMNFSECQQVVDTFAEKVRKLKHERKPLIIWKSTTFAPLEQRKFGTESHARFLTDQRIKLYNAYANWRLCQEGIHIYDVYALTSSYPHGTEDGLHYRQNVFSSADAALEEFLWENISKF